MSGPHRAPDVVAVVVDGETAVLEPAARRFHHLDEAATAVWTHLDGERSADAIATITGLATEAVDQTIETLVRLGLAVGAATVRDATWMRVPGVLARRAGDALLLMARPPEPTRLRGTAPAVLAALDRLTAMGTPATEVAIAAQLGDVHDDDVSTDDVHDACARLASLRVIRRGPAQVAP